jgi:RimJ/RimL family protein N-acetyltransferase
MPTPCLLLQTPRLDLIAATLDHVEAELNDRVALEGLLGVPIPEDWPPGEYDRNAQEFFRPQLASSGGSSIIGWLSWYAVTRNPSGLREALVAVAGYLGPPKNATVEIGCSVVPAARGCGYATEIVNALVAHALTHPDVREVVAHTSDANGASTRVLLRCGFMRVGPGFEPGSVEYRTQRGPHA